MPTHDTKSVYHGSNTQGDAEPTELYPGVPLLPGEFRMAKLILGDEDGPSQILDVTTSIAEIEYPPPYTAISYVWGDPSQRRLIRLNGEEVDITSSLAASLHSLRAEPAWETSNVYIWADQLCIDRSSLFEKSEQVKSMGQIYRNAQHVIVWLGEADSKTIASLGFFLDLHNFQDVDALLRDARYDYLWKAFEELVSRQWFKRRWVVQEFAMAAEVTFRIGSVNLEWRKVAAGFDLLRKRSTLYRESTTLHDLAARMVCFDVRRAFLAGQKLPLNALVTHLAPLESADPRDAIYALLGVASDSLGFEPDYSKRVEDVYEHFVEASAKQAKSLDVILQSWVHYEDPQLASWIAVSSRTGPQIQLVNPPAEFIHAQPVGSREYKASGNGPFKITWRFGEQLQAEGILLCAISLTGSMSMDAMIPLDWFEIAYDVNIAGEGVCDPELWRVLLADRDPLGRDPPPESYQMMLQPDLGCDAMQAYYRSPNLIQHYLHSVVQKTAAARRLVRTTVRKLALVPKEAEVDDCICILRGCSVPVVLRRGHNGSFLLVGECYLNHFMDGEILEDHTARWETLIIDRTRIDSRPVQENMLPDLVGSNKLFNPRVKQKYNRNEELRLLRRSFRRADEVSGLLGLETSPRYAISTGDDGRSVEASGSVLRARWGSTPRRKVTQRLEMLATPEVAEETERLDTESPSNFALRRLRIKWESPSGYKGSGMLAELRPGAVQRYAERLTEDGFSCKVESIPIEAPLTEALRLLRLRASISAHNAMITLKARFSRAFGLDSSTPEASTAVLSGFSAGTVKLKAAASGTGASGAGTSGTGTPGTGVPGAGAAGGGASGSRTSGGSQTPGIQNIQSNPQGGRLGQAPRVARLDFLLLCIKSRKHLTTRSDLAIHNVVSDQQLFTAIQEEYTTRRGSWRRAVSLKTVQRITFVKFALRENNEVGPTQVDQLPPTSATHYQLDPWIPDFVPPMDNDNLMLRFNKPSECQNSTFCYNQFAKRIDGPVQRGMPPDLAVAWGLHFTEGYDAERVIGVIAIGIVISLLFAIPYAIFVSVGDAFTTASYILTVWLGLVAALQTGINP